MNPFLMRLILSKKSAAFWLLIFNFLTVIFSQQTGVRGKVIDHTTKENLSEVTIIIKGTQSSTKTNMLGEFNFLNSHNCLGEQIIIITKEGYVTKQLPIIIREGIVLDLEIIDLDYDTNHEQIQVGMINLSEDEINGDKETSYLLFGLLQSTKEVFFKAAAYDFSAAFFRPRGLGSENGKVLINGLEMNKFFNGSPQWSNWGGLNDVQRNQQFSMGVSANEYTFGDLGGATNIIMKASQYSKGGRVSFATSNKSYTNRFIVSYNSGLMKNNWAYSVCLSRRFGKEGLINGTFYDANSIFISVEKKINEKHSLNFTGFYSANNRGKSTSLTEEVFKLKGKAYNPNWGYQNGKKRNSRAKSVIEPVFMFNHYWDINKKTSLQTSLAFQTGQISDSRLHNGGTDLITLDNQEAYTGGGRSKDINPVHTSNLPSYYLQNLEPNSLDFQNAYLAEQNLLQEGQLNWDNLIEANLLNTQLGKNATYIVYEDRKEDTEWTANTILNSQIFDNISFDAAINFKSLNSQNYAKVADLLGGSGFLDIDVFALNNKDIDLNSQLVEQAQSDLRNRNRIVGVGDRFNYNYIISAKKVSGFSQLQFKYDKVDFFFGGKLSQTLYQRNGLYENGYFPENASIGKSKEIDFINYGIKGGITYKVNGRHMIDVHGTYFTKAPTIRNSFANIRKSNSGIEGANDEKVKSIDVGYSLRTPIFDIRVTGYYSKMEDLTEVSFFFSETISFDELNETSGFVQENLTDIGKQYFGAELGMQYQITPTIKLKGAAAIGQFTYYNNPNLELFTDQGLFDFGKAYLKGYKLSNGPQNVAQLGFEYSDPDFWWIGVTSNYFSNAYIDISPFKRTDNFVIDPIDGQPFNDYDDTVARELLKQEKFNDFYLVNIIGGKSWRIKGYYVGFFASINNVFNQEYKTGGYEQVRKANYRSSLEESLRDTPVFGSKYFYGYSTSYYLNLYLKF